MNYVKIHCLDMQRSKVIKNIVMAAVLVIIVKILWNYFTFNVNPPVSDDHVIAGLVQVHGQSSVGEESMVKKKKKKLTEELKSDGTHLQKGLHAFGSSFYLDGEPFRILSGSFHYFRVHPAQWRDRLVKMKAAGLNTVTTYIPWNLHEPKRGQVKLDGAFSLLDFIKQVSQAQLYLIIRAGPYICAEWEFGGLPAWLLRDPNMIVRRSIYKPYLSAVESYFSKLLPAVAKQSYQQGGPIIAFQIENEFGSMQVPDKPYLHFLLEAHKKYGIEELFFTSDGAVLGNLERGSLKGVLATVNFWKDPQKNLQVLSEFQPNKPLMVAEFWSGWFDHWRESHHRNDPEELKPRLDMILNQLNASINFYMFVGGSNHNFFSGANNFSGKYEPTVTSYDYDAPISENGDITPKYMVIRELLHSSKLRHRGGQLSPLPSNPQKEAYGKVHMESYVPFENLISIFSKSFGNMEFKSPVSVESLNIYDGNGQAYGWILYRGQFKGGEYLLLEGYIRDRMQLFINNNFVYTYDWTSESVRIELHKDWLREGGTNTIDMFVENMGRTNFKGKFDPENLFDIQRKGFLGSVRVGDKSGSRVISGWQHVPVTFDSTFRESVLKLTSVWKTVTPNLADVGHPVLVKGRFNIFKPPKDTFIYTNHWGKGIVIVNNVILGRYWEVGPQKTIYLPGPLLRQGENTIMMFELEKPQTSLELIGQALLG